MAGRKEGIESGGTEGGKKERSGGVSGASRRRRAEGGRVETNALAPSDTPPPFSFPHRFALAQQSE